MRFNAAILIAATLGLGAVEALAQTPMVTDTSPSMRRLVQITAVLRARPTKPIRVTPTPTTPAPTTPVSTIPAPTAPTPYPTIAPPTSVVTTPTTTVRHTRMVYFVPADRAVRDDYRAAIDSSVRKARDWMRDQTGGKTFTLHPNGVEVCRGVQSHDYYAYDSWTRVTAALSACGLPWAYYDPNARWIVYADVTHQCDAPGRLGAGANGITIMPKQDLEGLIGNIDPADDCGKRWNPPAGRWIGGLIHEFGHALGIDHPAGCNNNQPSCDSGSIMWLGYYSWPNAYFSETERAFLRTSPFLADSVIAVTNAASYSDRAVAPNSLAAIFGADLATTTATSAFDSCRTELGSRRVSVRDAMGGEHRACLGYVGAGQINLLVPAAVAPGVAEVRVIDASTNATIRTDTVTVARVAPGLFAGANSTASGYVLADRAGVRVQERIDQPIALGGANDSVYLVLYGTGLANRAAQTDVTATIGGVPAEVLYAGTAPQYPGVDQINLRLPRSLAGRVGSIDIQLKVMDGGAGALTNVVKIQLR